MDNKRFQPSVYFTTRAAATSNNTNNMDHYLRQIHNHSHNITKPMTKKFPFDPSKTRTFNYNNHYYLTHPQLQPPPPVYNVTKHEFKEVVQRLTGSPSHNHNNPTISMAPPPPIQKPKPPSTRLQRIRPPPLAQVSNRQVMMLNNAFTIPSNSNPVINDVVVAPFSPPPPFPFSPLPPFPSAVPNNHVVNDPVAPPPFSPLPPFPSSAVPSNPVVNDVVAPPFSPLPPLPSVCVAAESPVSAYMRFLNSSVPTSPPSILFSPSSDELGFAQLFPSPRGGGWNGL